jgi:hypothetical protein
MSYEAKDTILRVVRTEGDQFFELVDDDAVWEAPTGAGHWQVRDRGPSACPACSRTNYAPVRRRGVNVPWTSC